MNKGLGLVVALLFMSGCGGDSGSGFLIFQRPIAIRASSAEVAYDGHVGKFVYVANERGGSLSVFDQVTEHFVDMDSGDEYNDSFVAVGGEPSALAVIDRTTPRVYVADGLFRQLVAFDARPKLNKELNYVPHIALDLGTTTQALVSTPLFKNEGRVSSPVMMSVTADPNLAKTEQWKIEFDGSDHYSVYGSKSGLQFGKASEGKPYTTDDGALSFTIFPGADPTDEGDIFRLAVTVTKPLPLTGRPIDLLSTETQLLIVTEDPAEIVLFNLDTLAIDSTITLDDGTGIPPQLGLSAIAGGHLYVPNRASSNVFDVDITGVSATFITTGIAAHALGADLTRLYLIPDASREVIPWDLGGGTPLSPIRLSDFGMVFQPYTNEGVPFAAVGTAAGSVEVLNLSTLTRIDTEVTGDKPESTYVDIEFEDKGAASGPELISVNLVDGLAKTERWQLTFDAVDYIVSGSISGIQTNRAVEGFPYTNDDGSMSLTIRGAPSAPTTKGDYFTFLAVDGINSIRSSNSKGAASIAVVIRPNDTHITAYVVEEGTSQIASYDLTSLDLRKTVF